jgi:hypothetical protein
MNDDVNDLRRIAERLHEILDHFVTNTHNPNACLTTAYPTTKESDSVTMTKNAWMATAIEIGRLAHWVNGLATTHERTKG